MTIMEREAKASAAIEATYRASPKPGMSLQDFVDRMEEVGNEVVAVHEDDNEVEFRPYSALQVELDTSLVMNGKLHPAGRNVRLHVDDEGVEVRFQLDAMGLGLTFKTEKVTWDDLYEYRTGSGD